MATDARSSTPSDRARRQRWRRRLVWIGAGAVLLLLLVLLLRPSAAEVETAVASRGPLRVTLTAEGRTRVQDRYGVVAPVTGTLARIELDPGDVVDDGGTIARILPATAPLLDPRTRADAIARRDAAEARLAEAVAALARARNDRAFAAREVERVRALADAGAVAVREVEEAERALDAAQATLAAAESAVRAARAERQAAAAAVAAPQALAGDGGVVLVRAPAGGQVLRVLERGPGLVQAGTPLVEVGDASRLEVVADLLTQDAVHVAAGAPATILTGSSEFPARVRRVEPGARTEISALGVEEQRVDVVLDFVTGTDGDSSGAAAEDASVGLAALGDGFRVDARIVLAEREDALRVPTSALFRDGDAWAVFVVRDGRAERRRLQIGVRGEREAEVLDGLEAGEVVVLYPGDAVRDGVRVR